MMKPILLAVALPCAALSVHAVAGPALPAAAPPPLYTAQCASCHGAHLEGGAGGPALRGKAVAAEDPGDLYAIVKTQMPLTSPGSLSDAQAKALTAYIVAQNKP